MDESALREHLHHIAVVTREQTAAIDLDYPDHGLDEGEHHLVAYAATLGNQPIWLLNSPDKGTIRFCSRAEWLGRLVSLQAMTDTLGLPHGRKMRGNYTRSWLETQVNPFRFGQY